MKRRMLLALSLFLALAILASSRAAMAQGDDSSTDAGPDTAAETQSFASVFLFSYHTDANGERHLEPVGTGMTWLLLLLSMFNFGLIGRLALINTRKSIMPLGVVEEVKTLVGRGEFRQTLDLTRREPSFFSTLLHGSLSEAGHGVNAMLRTMENTSDLLVTSRMRPIELLYMLGQISPMMGLLGTVYGIIQAFLSFVSSGGNASPVLLAGGIGTALVATFWGLVVAIPALAGYAILRNKVNELTMDATNTVEELINQLRPRAGAATGGDRRAPVAAPSTGGVTGGVIAPSTPVATMRSGA